MDDKPVSSAEINARLRAFHEASLELVQDVSLESLLRKIVELASQLAHAQYGALGVLGENGELENFITVGMAPEEIARMAHPPRGLGLIGALMHSPRPIRIPNIGADPRRIGFPQQHPPMKAFLGVPIRKGSRQLGQIYLTNKLDALEFTAQDEQMIEMLAAYAGAAISNAHLYKELVERDRILTRRNENLALLNELASTLTVTVDIDEALAKAIEQVMEYLHIEAGEIFLRQEESRLMSLSLHRGGSVPSLFRKSQFIMGEGLVGGVAQEMQPRMVLLTATPVPEIHPAVLESGICQLACFPLVGFQGVWGVLAVASCNPDPLDELEMQFLANISSWLGTAIESARLGLKSRRLAILEERERFGMDLHDGVIQSIYAVGLTLEHARLLLNEDAAGSRQRIEQAISDLNSTIRDIRAYILDLRPRQLRDDNLMQGLQRLVNEFYNNSLVPVNLQGPTEGFPSMTDSQALAIFHICQEALANIAKHAHADRVDVVVWKAPDRVVLEVHDTGRGFDPEGTSFRLGHGLSNMQSRARNVGGDVDISSEPGNGTTVLAWVPYAAS